MKSGAEYLAKHPGWKSKGKHKKSAAKSKRRYRYDDGNTHTDNLTLAEAQKFQRMQNGGTITPMDRVADEQTGHLPGCMAYKGIRCICKQIKEKHETPGCTCAERSWYGPGHDSACPLGDVVMSEGQQLIKADVAQRALAFINSACNHDEVINRDKSIGAAVRTLQDGLRQTESANVTRDVAPSGKRITKQQAEARAGLIPESDWEEIASQSEYFNESETATVLAALRHWQKTGDVAAFPDHFEGVKPLSDEEINDLCERINCGD